MKSFRQTISLGAMAALLAGAAPAQSNPDKTPPGQSKPGDEITGTPAQAALKQVHAERAALLEEHRQALLLAEKAASPEAKLKIILDLEAAQRARRLKLHELAAKVREAEKKEQETHRPQNPNGG